MGAYFCGCVFLREFITFNCLDLLSWPVSVRNLLSIVRNEECHCGSLCPQFDLLPGGFSKNGWRTCEKLDLATPDCGHHPSNTQCHDLYNITY